MKKPGTVYYLYERDSGITYFSMLSPTVNDFFFCNICFLYIFAVYYLTELSSYLAVYFVLSKFDAVIEVLFYLNCKYFLFLLQASSH